MGVPPNERSKEAVKSFTGQSFQVFVCLWPIIWFLSPHLTSPRTLPTVHVQLFSKMDSSPEAYGGPWRHILWGGAPSFLTPKESFCTHAMSPLPQGWEICDLWIYYSNKG